LGKGSFGKVIAA